MEFSKSRKKVSSGSWSCDSAEDFEHTCQSCHFEGNIVEAAGFCQNCQKYLCGSCIRYHRKATQSRRHIVLDQLEMPKLGKTQKERNVCTETCPKHTSELVKFFCKQHDIVGCSDCIVLGHKTCEIEYIADIIGKLNSGDECDLLVERMQALELKVEAIDEVFTKNAKEALSAHRNTTDELRNTRQTINEHLDKMEQRMVSQCTNIMRENEKKEETLKETIKTLKFELTSVKSQIKSHEKQTCDMFVTVKQATESLIKLEEELDSVKTNAIIAISEIERNQTALFDLSRWFPFGELVTIHKLMPVFPQMMLKQRHSDIAAEFTKEITDVMIPSDETICDIPGIVSLPNNTLAFVDRFNKCVKIMDTIHDKVTAQVHLTSEPFGITRIQNDQLAITLPDEGKIKFISLKEDITVSGILDVSGDCKGIVYTNRKFVVAYHDAAKVEIVSLQGKLLKLIKTDNRGNKLFKYPEYVAVGSDMESIYVSDTGKDEVIKVTFDGRVLARYTDSRSSWPGGLVVCNDGRLLVAVDKRINGQITSSIHHITSDCKKIKILIESGLIYSSALCLDPTNDRLFVIHGYFGERDFENRKIRIYKLIASPKDTA